MRALLVAQVRYMGSSDLGARNSEFSARMKRHQKGFKLHEKARSIEEGDVESWVSGQSRKQLADRMVRVSRYDQDVKEYVKKFNKEHEGKINLLDFSNYTTKFNDFKDNPISKKDMQTIRQFQKRKIDQKLHYLQKDRHKEDFKVQGEQQNPLQYIKDSGEGQEQEEEFNPTFSNEPTAKQIRYTYKNWFEVNDDFIMLLLERNMSTKVTTLNRINYFRTVLFMGNGNGIISYGKSRALNPEDSMKRAIIECKKNLIAIPLDETCTLPKPINSRFQDYHVYMRPLPGFNSYGHPVFSVMLALTGITHMGFKTVHTGKNNYTMLHSLFKAVTQNTTPQDMAELEGFKRYRHRFIRPLTEESTHNVLSY